MSRLETVTKTRSPQLQPSFFFCAAVVQSGQDEDEFLSGKHFDIHFTGLYALPRGQLDTLLPVFLLVSPAWFHQAHLFQVSALEQLFLIV